MELSTDNIPLVMSDDNSKKTTIYQTLPTQLVMEYVLLIIAY